MKRYFGLLSFFQLRQRVVVMALIATFGFLPTATISQTGNPVSLLADTINLDQSTGILTATGNVEVFFGNVFLKAQSIRYDSRQGTITAVGPIVLTDTSGSVILADFAELTSDMQQALIQGAKVLLENRLQLASTEFRRTDGRFDTMNNVIASTCEVCAARPVPVWQIRARQVIRDNENLQIHFRSATFEIFGLPVFYLPYMRIPDPSVTRASGFLRPSILSSEFFGDALKLPYFLVLSDYADATFTPTLTFSGAKVVDVQYRQRFLNGGFDAFAALAIADESGDFGRGFFALDGSFDIYDDLTLAFSANVPSDDGFLRQYDYDDTDRLVSEVSVSRIRDHNYFALATAIMTSLRDDEDDKTIPLVFPETSYRNYHNDTIYGGKFGYDLEALGLSREVGQDVLRVSGGMDWRVPLDLPLGLRASGFASVDADLYKVWDSVDFDDDILISVHPSVGADIRWPLTKTTDTARHILEPIVQLLYTADPAINDVVPNEDSLQIEFDETNLFDLNRFPGQDASETRFRANIGANYTIFDNDGWSVGVEGGLVFRSEPSPQFDEDSLLGGSRSDILGAVSFDFAPNYKVIGRFLFDDDFDFKRSDTQFEFTFDKWDLDGSLVYLAPDSLALASEERSEGTIAAAYRIADNWEVDFEWQRDLLEKEDVFGGVGVTYGNECIEIGLSLSRRFTSSNNVTPSTDIDLTIQLAGFGGTSQNKWPTARCVY